MTRLTSRTGSVDFGPGCPTLLINDQLRVIGQDPRVLKELQEGRFDCLMELARAGLDRGILAVDILIDHPDLDEVALLPRIARRLEEELGCFISLDSRNPAALEAALAEIYPSRAIINSVTAEAPLLESLLPVARKYNSVVVGVPVGEEYGLPHTVEGRLAEARLILDAAREAGIPRQDVIIDGICLATAAEPGSFQVAMETLRRLGAELGVTTLLGISNAGFGLPEPTVVDMGYLLAAISWGLDAALVDPETPRLVESVLALDHLVGNDPSGKSYVKNYRAMKKKVIHG